MPLGKRQPPDWEGTERKLWQENAEAVPERLAVEDPDFFKRVKTYMDRFGYTLDEVVQQIKNDPMFAAFFAKEPRRQSLHERLAAEWLREDNYIHDFQVLSTRGKKALYITRDGDIRGNLGHKPSKSLDFQWKTGKTTCYAMHKYTREGGGNQDSQYKEMLDLLQNFQRCRDTSCIFIVIVDGPYYNESKMQELKHQTRNHDPRSFAVHIEDVPDILREYL